MCREVQGQRRESRYLRREVRSMCREVSYLRREVRTLRRERVTSPKLNLSSLGSRKSVRFPCRMISLWEFLCLRWRLLLGSWKRWNGCKMHSRRWFPIRFHPSLLLHKIGGKRWGRLIGYPSRDTLNHVRSSISGSYISSKCRYSSSTSSSSSSSNGSTRRSSSVPSSSQNRNGSSRVCRELWCRLL